MKRHVTNAALALVITAISTFALFAQIGTSGAKGWVLSIAAGPLIPAELALAMLGLGSGPEGFPNHEDIALYIITFVLWWLIIEVGQAWMRQRLARKRQMPQV